MYLSNKKYQNILNNFNNEEMNSKYQISTINLNKTNFDKNHYKRSHSQSSSYFRPLKKNININLAESNANKSIDNVNYLLIFLDYVYLLWKIIASKIF